jgi:tetratricopeptide (TPR) repeat protein
MKIRNCEFVFFKRGIFTYENNKTVLLRMSNEGEYFWDGERYARGLNSRLKDYPHKQECETVVLYDRTKFDEQDVYTSELITALKKNFPNLKRIISRCNFYVEELESVRALASDEGICLLGPIDWARELEKQGDFASAEDWYNIAVVIQPGSLSKLYLGEFYVEQNKNLREAETLLESAANDGEDVGDAKLAYGRFLLKQGNIDDAWDMFFEVRDGWSDTEPRESAAIEIWELFKKGLWGDSMDYDQFYYCCEACQHSISADFLENMLLSYINDPQKQGLGFVRIAFIVLHDLYRDGKIKANYATDEDIIIEEMKNKEKFDALLRHPIIDRDEDIRGDLYENLHSFIEREDIPIIGKIDTLYKYRENDILEDYCFSWDDESAEWKAIVKEFAERGVAWAQDYLKS